MIRNVILEYTNDLLTNLAKTALVYKLTNDPEYYSNSLKFMYQRAKEFNKPPSEVNQEFIQRIKRREDKNLQREVIKVDKMIRNINFKISMVLEEVKIDGLHDINNRYKYKRHIFTVKVDPTIVKMFKQGPMCGLSGFGITFTTKNSLEML